MGSQRKTDTAGSPPSNSPRTTPLPASRGESSDKPTAAGAAPEGAAPGTAASLLPAISLPKGGGAIRGMGEKFAANPVTGTGSMTVPIPTSPGRSGFGPELTLSYDSGSGNGPFGFGWSLSLPSITRKTDKGLPRYEDYRESDVFVLSGAEDLVPLLAVDGTRQYDEQSAPGFRIERYRPRVEGLFARIERWTDRTSGEIHWRSITRDNVTTIYGKDDQSRIFDPAEPDPSRPARVFSWLICSSYDDKGNAIVYEYAAENAAGVDRTQANERNRLRTANRYLKRVRYGNRASRLVQPDLTLASWLFEVVFDYDEGHQSELPLDPTRAASEQLPRVLAAPTTGEPWASRPDPFSSYRSGFEVRTYRRCRRILMFHRFAELNAERVAELGDAAYLVRSTELEYADFQYGPPTPVDVELAHAGSTRFASFIQSITQSGYVRDDSRAPVTRNGVQYLTYVKRSLPPLELEYSKARIQDEIRDLDAASLANLPAGVDGSLYQWVDLDGEGASGIVTQHGGECFYKPSLGDGRFGPLRVLPSKPTALAVVGGGTQLVDLSGDGQLDVVAFSGPTPGFYERTQNGGWEPFRTFRCRPELDWEDPNLRFVDLDGDGHADVLVTENDCFTWYPSLGEEGFGPAIRLRQAPDEERGPRLVFADGTQAIYLADFSGDGSADLVRVRNGEICYWPNLGHGRFGAKITMDDAPRFDTPDQFDQKRIRLADIDGSGPSDVIYLGRDGVRLYFNQSGNRFTPARRLSAFPKADALSSVTTADLLGNGTACLVWSSPLPAASRRPLRYLDLMSGQKPHLLVRSDNNLGRETRVDYAASTKFYFADKLAGKPWITRIPFPVHVVERVTTHDRVSGNRFVSRYAYHHGYFDGVEREFRGFGMVEQTDTETFAASSGAASSNTEAAFFVPPVLTKTWFHTGNYTSGGRVSDYFAGLRDDDDAGEYYREPGLRDAEARQRLLPDTVLPPGLTPDEEREACRALKGMMLRQEVYALDGTAKAGLPFTVTEQNFTVEPLQRRGNNRHAVFVAHPRETLQHHYERNPSDPRIAHTLTLQVDAFGNVLKSLNVGYGRRTMPADPQLTSEDRARQSTLLVTYTQSTFTENDLPPPVAAAGHHRAPLPSETRTYELTGFVPESGAPRFSFEEWSRGDFALLAAAEEIPFEQPPNTARKQKRLVEQTRTLYRKDDLTGFSVLGKVESMALPGETYKLALTPSLIDAVFRRRAPADAGDEILLPNPNPVLTGQGPDQGGYRAWEQNYWVPSGRVYFDPAADIVDPATTAASELARARAHFFLVRKLSNPFAQTSSVDYDDHDLLPAGTRDALGNTVAATNDYRVLQPQEVRDPNRNRTAVAFDALGLVVATARLGKPGESVGDVLDGFDPNPTLAVLQQFIADPRGRAPAQLGRATTRILYDIGRFQRAGQPAFAASLARETHFFDAAGGATKIQLGFSYSDGFGREIQKKVQAEAGDAPQRQAPVSLPTGDVAPGPLIEDVQGALILVATAERWVGSGRTVFNNKGKPVKQYEPFFSATHLYEPEREVTDSGVSSVLFYDPVERVVATLHPNRTYEKVVFDPWRQATYDVNDTVAPRGAQTGDPRTDPEVAAYVAEYFKGQPTDWQTWYAQRIESTLGDAERDAARKAAVHADTPTVAHLDVLGRVFVSVAHNRYVRNAATVDEAHATRIGFDIQGNQREVRDALVQAGDAQGRVVMRYDYDLLKNRIRQSSMEAGERWLLGDATGKPIRVWDSRRFLRRLTYDELRRPTGLYVTDNGVERLAERTLYGESLGDANNHRTQVYRVFDAAGVVTNVAYDFKSNLKQSRRDLLATYKTAVDWSQNPPTTDGTFTTSTTYDALDRPRSVTSPDGSVYQPTFNEANLLDKVDARLRGGTAVTSFVTNIDYDAKGQRLRIRYGNGAESSYSYDPLTFRLTRLRTTRPAQPDSTASQLFRDPTVVQDLRYTYDPAGNLSRIEDAALRSVFFDGQQVEPVCTYTYDAVYRLIEAAGREHIGQTAFDFQPPGGNYRDFPFVGSRVNPNDLQALRNYTERYEYDAVGNFASFAHRTNNAGWTRSYEYQSSSLLEPGKTNNRLTRTVLGNGQNRVETYAHDAHGNMTSMPHLAAMEWDFKDQFQRADLGGGGTAYYVYDSSGQRVRKVIDAQNGTRQKQRLYLGGFEIYREYGGNGTTVNLERESLHVMDDKQRLALVETQTVQNGNRLAAPTPLPRYQLGNHLGSASAELDGAGALISYEEYHPYGTPAFQAGRSGAEVSLKRYRYTGKERDEETGFNYHGARYCAAWLGAWTSCDPLKGDPAVPLSLHRYLYAHANPIKFTDPDGKAINLAAAGIGALIGGVGGALIGAWTAKPGERLAAAGKGALIGAGSGALAGLTFGASLAATGAIGLGGTAVATGGTTGSILISGTLAGAVGGATSSAANTLASGGTGDEALQMASIGAFTGSVGGAVGAGAGSLTSNLAKSAGASLLARQVIGGASGGASGDVAVQSILLGTKMQEEFSPMQLLLATAGGGAGGGIDAKVSAARGPGILGKQSTRDQLNAISAELVRRGYTITGGGDRLPEEYIAGPGGARKGASHPDITATKDGKTIRVNTVDTLADGVTPNRREATNAARIRAQTGEHLLLVPKKK